jgi:hypothetical protein
LSRREPRYVKQHGRPPRVEHGGQFQVQLVKVASVVVLRRKCPRSLATLRLP